MEPHEAAARHWDVIVVGAGLAGIAIAGGLAVRGCSVLLVDQGTFPRHKTCGGTLNARAVAVLQRLGLGEVLMSLEPTAITGVEWRAGDKRRAFLDVPPGAVAVSRQELDAALLGEVIRRGASFLGGVRCMGSDLIGHGRRVELRRGEERIFVKGGLVVAADGLGSTVAQGAGLARAAAREPSSYLGCSAILNDGAVGGVSRDRITMALGAAGYTGIVQVEEGRWNVAAAVRLDALRRGASPGALALGILRGTGVSVAQYIDATWCVTQPVLHRTVHRPWAERLLLVGDAAGYVEPITGEGMAWALSGAEGAIALLTKGWSADLGPKWEASWSRRVKERRSLVQFAGFVARRPRLAVVVMAAIVVFPAIGRRVVGSLAQEVSA